MTYPPPGSPGSPDPSGEWKPSLRKGSDDADSEYPTTAFGSPGGVYGPGGPAGNQPGPGNPLSGYPTPPYPQPEIPPQGEPHSPSVGFGGQPGYGQPEYGQPGYGQPVPPGYGPQFGGFPIQPITNTKAILSLMFSIGSLFLCCGLGGILGIVLGTMALNEIEQSQGSQSGQGMANAGRIIGWIEVGLVVAFLVFALIASIANA